MCETRDSRGEESNVENDEFGHCLRMMATSLNQKEYDSAISYGERFLPMAQASDFKLFETFTYKALTKAHLEKQEYGKAISYGKIFLNLAQESGAKGFEMQALLMLAYTHAKKHEYDDAISYGKKYLPMSQESGDKEEEMKVYMLLGNVHMKKEEYDAAVSCYQNCLAIAEQSDDKIVRMGTYEKLGEAHLTKEEYDKAIWYGQKCLAIAQESGNKEKEMEAYKLSGDAHWKSNAYDDAYSCFIEGKEIAMDLQDDSYKFIFESYLNMIYGEVGIEIPVDFDADFFYAILEGFRFNPKNDTSDWATAYIRYNYHRNEQRYEQALSHLEEAEGIIENSKQGNDSRPCRQKMWFCKQGISEMYVKLGQHDEAMKYQQEAIAAAVVTRSQQATSHFSLGKLYYKRQELEKAKQSLEESLKCYELIFKDLQRNDRFKIAFVDKYKEAYKMLLKVLIETNKKEEALVLSDRYRAKALKDLLVSSYGMKEDPVAEDDLKYADVQSLVSSRNYSLLLYSSCDEELCTFLLQAEKELEFSVQHFEYCDKCLGKLVNKAFDEMQVLQVVNCEERSLDVMKDFEENKNPKEDELTRMLTRQKEERLTEQCRSICGCRGEPSENTDEASLTSGLEMLYYKLIHNIKCLVKEDEIVIIPEGPLCKVPFAALRDPDKGQYLSETKRIRMAPSMATLKLLQEYPEEHHSSKKALIIGAPIIGLVKLNGIEIEIPPLPGVIDEAIDIGQILGVRPLVGSKATKATVINRLQEGASVVHIAAHGSLEKAIIVLAPPEIGGTPIPDEEDYMLTMADVQQVQVLAQLVVLSCCHSGRGEIKAEGVVGMCRAFLASGARAVMGSLWAVDDEATCTFMETFYSHLKDGKSASTSLHLTMNGMRKTPKYSEPKYWAPFFLMGDDVTIKFED